MSSPKESRPGKKPTGIKQKTSASTWREFSLERHRQSYIRTWHAIKQAKQGSVELDPAFVQTRETRNKFTPQNTHQPASHSANHAQAVAEGPEADDLPSVMTRKRREGPNRLQRPSLSSSTKKTRPQSKVSDAPTTPEPSKTDVPSTPFDDESSQASGEGLFVTPNVKTSSKSSSAAPDDFEPAMLIPFPKRKSKRDLALVLNALDSPKVGGISKERLKAASRKVFGSKSVRKVYQSSPGVWMVRLRSQQEAKDGAGKILAFRGVEVVTEKILRAPSRIFVWRPEGVHAAPSSKEIADKVRQTLEWPLPDVKVEHNPRQVTLAFQKCPELLRFYLRLDSGVEARFDPVLR